MPVGTVLLFSCFANVYIFATFCSIKRALSPRREGAKSVRRREAKLHYTLQNVNIIKITNKLIKFNAAGVSLRPRHLRVLMPLGCSENMYVQAGKNGKCHYICFPHNVPTTFQVLQA